MIYLDTNIFVYALINNGKVGDRCRKILEDVAKRKIRASTSYLTWDEIVYSVRKERSKDIAIYEGRKILQFPNLAWLSVNDEVMISAQRLIESYPLKPRDAIHAASALANNISEISSDDPDFDKVKELKRVKP
jgi:uncharacterized protein